MTPEERAARARVESVNNDREGWVCESCDEDEAEDNPVVFLVRSDTDPWDGVAWPMCRWHADEEIHAAIPYGQNCSECGIQHAALWPD